MPGYCVDRFPDLSAEDREEYTCSICQDIFNTPVTTSCRHTFCEDCITEWLESNTTCPNDRKRLSPRKLSPASLVIVNTMGRFMIRSDYWDKGCRVVIKLDDLEGHTVNCSYNVTICTDCQTIMTSEHNCIESLLAKVETLNIALNHHGTNSGQPLPSLNSTQLSGNQMLAECRQHMSAPVMLINKMNADMRDKTVAIIRKMLAKHNTVSDVCKHAVDCMDIEFGTDWQCLAEWCAGTQRYLNPKKGFYLRVKFTPITFTMYHSKRLDWTNFKARLERNKIVRQLDNIETDMKASMVSVVTGIVLDAIDRSSSIRKTARNIEARMESRYEGTKWVCFLYDHGGYRINRYGKYMECNVDELNVTIFDIERE